MLVTEEVSQQPNGWLNPLPSNAQNLSSGEQLMFVTNDVFQQFSGT